MVAPSRLEKSEQLVNVATTRLATTHEAARDRKEERAESMTCTIILIQKSIQPAQLVARKGRDELIWFIWFVLFIWLDKFNQTNQTDQINKRNQPVLALHEPRLVIDSPTPLG